MLRLTFFVAVFAAATNNGYICPMQLGGVADCLDCEGHQVLNVDTEVCIDRPIFSSDFVPLDIIALVAWFVGAGLAVSAGVGGGGIFVPLGALLLRFDPKPATGLSQASIFGASLAGLLLNSMARHPIADRPLIDVDMVLFLAPMEMAGAVLGYIVLSMCPNWFVILLMVTVLGYTGFRTVKKGRETWAKEKKSKLEAQKAKEAEEAKEAKEADCCSPTNDGMDGGIIEEVQKGVEPCEVAVEETAERAETSIRGKLYTVSEWLAKDAARPTKQVIYLAVLWIILLAVILLKGGKGKSGKSIVPDWEYCGAPYWGLTAFSFVWLLGFALIMGRRAVSKTVRKIAVDFPFVEGDVMWTWKNFSGYAAATFIAGVIAGMIGIGGGMVLGPLMLQLGVNPRVSTASTATMIALTSSSVAAMAVIQGNVPWSYALTFFVTAFSGALIGKSKIDAFVKRKQLTAILIFLLAGIICFAALMMAVYGLIKYSEKGWEFTGPDDQFRVPCE